MAIFAPLDDLPLRCIPSKGATLMVSMSLYVFGPVAALVLGFVLYVVERAPIIGVRWLWFLGQLDDYRRKRRGR